MMTYEIYSRFLIISNNSRHSLTDAIHSQEFTTSEEKFKKKKKNKRDFQDRALNTRGGERWMLAENGGNLSANTQLHNNKKRQRKQGKKQKTKTNK